MAESTLMVSMQDVQKWFGELHVLQDINLEIPSGEFVVFVKAYQAPLAGDPHGKSRELAEGLAEGTDCSITDLVRENPRRAGCQRNYHNVVARRIETR